MLRIKVSCYGTLALGTLLLLVGCSASTHANRRTDSRPLFYPNRLYQDVGEQQANRDADTCLDLAEEYVSNPDKYKDVAIGTGAGAAVGAATGALAGVITKGNVGRATGAGAAVGAVVSLLREMIKANEPSPSYKRFTEHCLVKKGYEVYGWS